MRKFLTISLVAAALFLPVIAVVGGGTAHAVDVLDPVCTNADPNNLPTVCKENASGSTDNPIFGPNGILTRGISILARLVGIVAVIAIVVYGFKFVTAGGDAGDAKTARQAIVYAIIGLVAAALAQGIVTFVLNNL